MSNSANHGGDPLGLTRRHVLQMGLGVIALKASIGMSFAATFANEPAVAQFLTLSQLVTGYDDLNPLTASRILDALCDEADENRTALERLTRLATQTSDPKALQAAATQAGLGDLLTTVLSAWYTGTVTPQNGLPTVVSYREALMYRPVEDGLVVPTYCNKGPMWWRDALPPDVVREPVNNPKVL